MIVLGLPAISVDPACILYSDLFRGYVSIVCDDVHWARINCNVYDVSLAFVPSSIVCSLYDAIHEYLDVGDGYIESQLERSYFFLIDDNVVLVCVFSD